MVRRRVFIALGWAVVTASAVAIASLAVSHAVANVADPVPAMLSSSSSSSSSTAEGPTSTSTTVATVDANPSTTTTPSVVADGSVASADASSFADVASPPVVSGIADPVTVQSSDESSAAPPPPAANTRSFSKTGGVVTMSCDGDAATLVSATPASGYTVTVSNPGPEEIEVAFTSGSRESDFHGQCVNGQPTEQVSDD